MIDFGGWALPVHFSSILEKHHAVRTGVGLFDVFHMAEILVEGRNVESYVVITSGTQSPTLKKSIGLALLDKEYAEIGTTIKVEIRNKRVDAISVRAPFYKRV